MDYICQVCDGEVIENEDECQYYSTTLHRKKDKKLYIKYTNNNINFNELGKILNDYIATHIKKTLIFI